MDVVFQGIDSFNRPVFKDIESRDRYGSCDKLFSDDATEDEVLKEVTEEDLLFFGLKFGCEPMGTPAPKSLRIIRRSTLEERKRISNVEV